MIYASKGIAAWRVPLVPWMLGATGLFEGLGLLSVAAAFGAGQVARYGHWRRPG